MFQWFDNAYVKLQRSLEHTAFLKQVLFKVMLGLLLTTTGVALSFLIGFFWIPGIIQILVSLALIIGMFVAKHYRSTGWTQFFYYSFTLVEGFFLAPLFIMLLQIPAGGLIIFASIGMTALIFTGVTLYVMAVKQPKLAPALGIGLLCGLLGVGLLAYITGLQGLILLHACLGVGLFTLFLAVDLGRALYMYTANMSEKNQDLESTILAMSIYLDLINIMLDLMVLMSGGNKGHRYSGLQTALYLTLGVVLVLPFLVKAIYNACTHRAGHTDNHQYQPVNGQGVAPAAGTSFSSAQGLTPSHNPQYPNEATTENSANHAHDH